MKAVYSWLMELVDLDREIPADEAAAALTAGGLEIEALEEVGRDFEGVVIAEVAARRPHPDADKLTVVEVIDAAGGTATEVVCGAPNVPAPGGRVLWARPGARLPGGMAIGSRELKGVRSHGMLCSEKELGLGEDHDGIVVLEEGERAALGAPAASALGLADAVLDVGVPANRPDALGHIGLARELVAHLGGRLRRPAIDSAPAAEGSAAALVEVAIEAPDRCRRYIARVIDDVAVRPAPRSMRRRLSLVGVRPLSNLVDVTNYVMFETAQPLHAFDHRRVRGQRIVVREAREGEAMITLDGIERRLERGDLVISDGQGPVALAGVMGGLESEVAGDTTRVLLEAAHFEAAGVRRTSRRLGLRSESSIRFERQADAGGADWASARAAALIAELGGGAVVPGSVDCYPRPVQARTVPLRPARATALTGIEISGDVASQTLSRLGLEVAPGDPLTVTVPSHRPDLVREVDLIEEVLRIWGLDRVPATLPALTAPPRRGGDRRPDIAREVLVGAGLSEAVTFGFTSPERTAAFGFAAGDPRATPIPVRNPMSLEQSVMRTSLLVNLLAAVAHNLKHQVSDVALFEVGSVFLGPVSSTALAAEPTRVAAVMCGRGPGHLGERPALDVFELKGVLDSLAEALAGGAVRVAARRDIGHLHPGLAAELRLASASPSDPPLGELGEIHPRVREAFGIEVPVFAFDIALDAMPMPAPARMEPIVNYPAITRDLSFFVDAAAAAEAIRARIRAAGEPLLESAEVLEDYRDPRHVPAGQKGMLWSFTYRARDRTLTDAEVDAAHAALSGDLLEHFAATRR
jgi:phenylalanyl-tRNA synthetase beta chain